VYRSKVTDAVPAGVPRVAAEAARDTLGGALSAAQQLPDRLGQGLVDAARAAFTQGLHLTAVIGALIAIGIAILVATRLRHLGAGSEPEADTVLKPAPSEY
ncbi:MAG: MFS transporter, partial [Actinomycetota bacterium]